MPSAHNLTATHSNKSPGDRKRKRNISQTTPGRPRPTQPSHMEAMYSFAARTPSQLSNGHTTARRTSLQKSPGFNAHTGAKKLVVKNIKAQSQWDSKAYLDKIWTQLDAALDIILKNTRQLYSNEDLYRGVENVCRQGGASTLYTKLEHRCRTHVESDIHHPLAISLDGSNVEVLDKVIHAWTTWKEQMSIIHSIFYFLDRSYLLSSSKPTIAELTPKLFREIVLDDAIKGRTIQGACDLVTEDRQAHSLPPLFASSVSMFNDLSVYNTTFEPHFLDKSKEFTSTWAGTQSQTSDVPTYVGATEKLIEKELERCTILATTTRRDLLATLENDLVVDKVDYLTAAPPLAALLDKNDTQALTALYNLLARRKLGSRLRTSFEKWVNDTGTAIVFADKSDDMVTRLLNLQRQLDIIWRNSFQSDESLGHGLRESFEIFMNKTKKGDATWGTDNTKVGEMIAKYVDLLLRGGVKALPELNARRTSIVEEDDEELDEDAEMSSQLDQALDLFRFVHGKAVFEAFYKKDLARRLLMARSASADAERSMLTRLKTECGSGFTQNLEQMFKDVELAREEMQSYKQRLEDRLSYDKGKDLDLSVNILSAAAWPTYPDIPVIIPANIKKAIDDFELHYKNKHTGRKLDWKHSLAHCQMRAVFPKGSKELVVSSFQAIVLLLFNGLADGDTLTYTHILSESGLPEVKRTLQSLACAKLQPLSKRPKGKEINDTDVFSINDNFSHPKYRVKINQVQLKETKQENKETHMRVAEDRNFECQAAIVRIMKSRKTIGHSELVSEVIKATVSRGVLAVADIKKNIDRLIEKDYMEREDNGGYAYVA
ncbi:hypothetical protein AMS68_000008 [Peltaster fructicola]|uniref:Cullin family profile domain-containing protein n=1 Tax=Peltaster fructicola TaxID=286661 RepID=A0A6H0XIM5_9PEZI|nr:hypothetical protein AMS68_000008 [Peltaster fructicola]